MPTATWKSRLRSGSAHCDLQLAVEVRQCPLGSGARGGGPAVPTGIWTARRRRRVRRRRRRKALLKSSNPHLAGGGKKHMKTPATQFFLMLRLINFWRCLKWRHVCSSFPVHPKHLLRDVQFSTYYVHI